MRYTLKIEELAMCLGGIFAFSFLSFDWWWFLALFFVPDIGMLGYVYGNKTGASFYNLWHHKGLAIAIGIVGILISDEILQLTGIILFSHASFDRILGYGLKYEDGFKFTHLGEIRNSRWKTYQKLDWSDKSFISGSQFQLEHKPHRFS